MQRTRNFISYRDTAARERKYANVRSFSVLVQNRGELAASVGPVMETCHHMSARISVCASYERDRWLLGVATASCQGAHYAVRRLGCAGLPCWAPFHVAKRVPGPAAPRRDHPGLLRPSLSRAGSGGCLQGAALPPRPPPVSPVAAASRWRAVIQVRARAASSTRPASEERLEVSSLWPAWNQPFVLPCRLRHSTHRVEQNAHVSRRGTREPPMVARPVTREVVRMFVRMVVRMMVLTVVRTKPPVSPLLDSTHGTTGGTCYASTTPPQSFTWWRARHEGTGHHE